MIRPLAFAALLVLAACHQDAPAVNQGQSRMADKAVADVDAATAAANGAAASNSTGDGTKSAP